MLERLTTEQTNPESRHLDEFSMVQVLETMNAADAQVAAAVAQEIPRIAAAAEAITAALESGGSLIYIGAGTSGRLGVLDAAECPPTFGVPPELVRGHHGGRRTGSGACRGRRGRRSRCRRPRPGSLRIRSGRRSGGDFCQRPNPVCAWRRGKSPRDPGRDVRDQLRPGLRTVAPGPIPHRTRSRPGNPHRLDPASCRERPRSWF